MTIDHRQKLFSGEKPLSFTRYLTDKVLSTVFLSLSLNVAVANAAPSAQMYDAAMNAPLSAITRLDIKAAATKNCGQAKNKKRAQQRYAFRAETTISGAKLVVSSGKATPNCSDEFPVVATLAAPADKQGAKSKDSSNRARVTFRGTLAKRTDSPNEYHGVLIENNKGSGAQSKRAKNSNAPQLVIQLADITVSEAR
jgi:hypothetical protein